MKAKQQLSIIGYRRLLAATISLSIAISSPSAMSLGLGEAAVETRIGEPLQAEIPILDSASYDVNEILVRQIRGTLAKQLGFELAADSRSYFLKVIEREGQLVLLVRSQRVMSEPFVSLLVELEWPNGKLYRDYNLLLDLAPLPVTPPHKKLIQSSSSSSYPSTAAALPEPVAGDASTETRKDSTNHRNSISRYVSSADSAPVLQEHRWGWRVGNGDTLSQIAQRIRPSDQIKLVAVVDALFRLNPHAFANGDINQMQGGSVLNLPSPEDFQAMPRWDGRAGIPQSAQLPPEKRASLINSSSARKTEALNRSAQNVNAPSSKISTETTQITGIDTSSSGINKTDQFAQTSAVSSSASESEPFVYKPTKYQIKSGDTLSQVAQKLRQDPGVRLQDMMQLLYESNPGAFANGDMHQLQLGAQLTVPPHGRAMPQTASSGDSSLVRPPTVVADKTVPVDEGAIQASMASLNEEGATRLTLSAQTDRLVGNGGNEASSGDILRQIDAVAELVDKVNRENQAIRQRIEKIERSEQLVLLERLLELQTRQIQNLRNVMLEEEAARPSDGVVMEESPDFVASSDSSLEGALGEDGVTSIDAALLQHSLSGQDPQASVIAENTSEVLAQAQQSPATGSMDEFEEKASISKVSPSGYGSAMWGLVIALLAIVAWWLVRQRREIYELINNKLHLFEQNKEDASLPRVWDPELGAWRVKEDIRRPLLTPLATQAVDLDERDGKEPALQAAKSGVVTSAGNNNGEGEATPSGTIEEGDDTISSRSDVDNEIDLNFSENKSQKSEMPEETIEFSSEDIDSMFEELSDDESTGDDLSDVLANAEVSPPDFPLLNETVKDPQPEKELPLFDNLDGEFEFSLPDELFADPEASEKPKLTSPADEQVKASIQEKTKNYNPSNIDDVLSSWLHNSIPAPVISEYEDIISEAMIYAAYGRHEHAEQLLLEQLRDHPGEEKLEAALADVRKSNAQFKGGQGFGETASDETLILPKGADEYGDLSFGVDADKASRKDDDEYDFPRGG